MSNKTILDFRGSPMGNPNDPPFKEGTPAKHPLGVLYQGPWQAQGDGFNEHVRRCARALATTGCPVQLRSLKPGIQKGVPKDLPMDVEELLRASIHHFSVEIHQLIPDETTFTNLLTHRYLTPEQLEVRNRFKVLSTVFERDRLSKELIQALDRAVQVWVACKANANVLQNCGLKAEKVRVVPIPHFSDDPLLKLQGRERLPGPVRFYNIGKWEPRKNQDKILLAFMRAFQPGEAVLAIKTSPGAPKFDDYPVDVKEALALALKDELVKANGWATDKIPGIFLKQANLSLDQIFGFHKVSDVYISLSSGEGFDMPAYDAKLAGNLMVYTASGGPQDFAGPMDVHVTTSKMKPVSSFYSWWEKDAQYLDIDVDQAAIALRSAHARVLGGVKTSVTHLEQFRAENVGREMLKNLEAIVEPWQGRVF